MSDDDLRTKLRKKSRDWLISAIVVHREDFIPNVESYTDDELREMALQEMVKNLYERERDEERT